MHVKGGLRAWRENAPRPGRAIVRLTRACARTLKYYYYYYYHYHYYYYNYYNYYYYYYMMKKK